MKLQNGFTLIELMVTVAILAILASVAMPSYTNYVIRGKIPDAISNLSSKRTQMEQYYQDNRTYLSGAVCPAAVAPDATASKFFTFSCVATALTYTITATGIGSMAGFSYTIDQGNNKTSAIAAPAPAAWVGAQAACWISKTGGIC
jgi:type IV pilus assembly protein PilE